MIPKIVLNEQVVPTSPRKENAGIVYESGLVRKSAETETPSMNPSMLIIRVFHPDESTPRNALRSVEISSYIDEVVCCE